MKQILSIGTIVSDPNIWECVWIKIFFAKSIMNIFSEYVTNYNSAILHIRHRLVLAYRTKTTKVKK